MSTPALVGVKVANNAILAIYVHWDGYPSFIGKRLLCHFQTKEEALALVGYGDCRYVDKPNPQGIEEEGYTERLKNGEAATNFPTLMDLYKEACERWVNYIYIFQDGHWVWSPVSRKEFPQLKPLTIEDCREWEG